MRERSVNRVLTGRVCTCLVSMLALTGSVAHAQTGAETNVGYIDSALPLTQFRLRYDSAYDDNRPERVDFLYSANGLGPFNETKVNYQEATAYMEWAPLPRLSGFVEVPYRWIDPVVNADQHGWSDINVGFKFALLYDPDQVLTFQFRTYTPTGSAGKGLGTDHYSFEPALLFYQRLTERLSLEAELRDWIPGPAPDNFAGNVLRYGVGVSYQVYDGDYFRVNPVVELVGWTILSGLDERDGEVGLPAAGETIVNAKVGVRIGMGEVSETTNAGRADLYIGYGRALTGEVWYKNILRVELRIRF
jgi:Putative MetA-pathway of phenol degradation